LKAQSGGVWREIGGGSMAAPNTARTQSYAASSPVTTALPSSGLRGPATVNSPRRARSGGILASHSPANGHPASGARSGASSGVRSGGSKYMGHKKTSSGAHSPAGKKNQAGVSHASGAGPSSSHAKTQPASSTMGGIHQPGLGREPIP
jgi:hypothetical protein